VTQAESDKRQMAETAKLLVFAAKAIGFELHANQAGATQLWKNGSYVRFWNPIAYDGDAFRLAVALGLDINAYPASNETSACKFQNGIKHRCIERTDDDPCAATRLAITRAAASVGESTP
jgi:hypothetical protein